MAIAVLWPALAHAAAFRIQLTDGSEIVGTIQAFEDGIYGVSTSTGQRRLRVDAVRSIEPVTTTASIDPQRRPSESGTYPPVPEFTLATVDSRVVVGRLLGFEDGTYEVQTKSGIVRLAMEKVRRMDLAWVERPPPPPLSATPLSGGLIRIAGSDTMATLHVPAIVEAYSAAGGGRDPLWSRSSEASVRTFAVNLAERGKFTVAVRSTEVVTSLKAVIDGQIDVALLPRRALPDELRRLAGRGPTAPLPDVQEFELAPGGVAVIVHRSNPVNALTLDQIAGIMSGRIRSWSDVGGPQRRIQVFALEEGSGILELFQSRVMGSQSLMATVKRTSSNAEMSDIVGSDLAAIGIAEYSYAGNTLPLALIDSCGNEVKPDEFSLQTREYALSTPLYLYTHGKMSPTVRQFVEFAVSPSGQAALKQNGLVSFTPVWQQRPQAAMGLAKASADTVPPLVAAELTRFMATGARMSVAMEMNAAGSQLIPTGEREIERLSDYAKRDGGTQRIVLFGYAYGRPNLNANVRQSERMAQIVEQKLKERGVKVERVFGLGPLLPLSCDKTPEAMARNHRVEAWVY